MRAFYALVLLALSCTVAAQTVVKTPTAQDAAAAADPGEVQTPTIYLAPVPAAATAPAPVPAASSATPRLGDGNGPGGSLSLVFKPIKPAQMQGSSAVGASATVVAPVTPPPPPPAPKARGAAMEPAAPAASVAAANPGFLIGPGDTIQVDVLGHLELSAKGNVSGDGRVNIALVGPIVVGGLSPLQASEAIAKAYRDGNYLVSPQVTVTMIEYQSQLLTVLGEVHTPGRFPVKSRLSILDGIALAGGIGEKGGSTAFLLRSENGVVNRYEVDLDALVQSGAGQQYFEVLAGDTVMVPPAPLFYIYGEVRNPNAYKLKPGMTVIQALSLAGGLTDKGSNRRIDLRRKSASQKLDTRSASLFDVLSADDVLYVKERLF